MHEASGLVNITPKSQSTDLSYIQRSAPSLPQLQHGHPSHQQQHSQQYSHSSQSHTHYNSSSQPPAQQHQLRPPIPPNTHQPRLHHSMSAGNISMAVNVNRYTAGHGTPGAVVGGGPNTVAGAPPPKKKDPYATAWRTYSKIAEELQLSNPDGTLYPISKEAILKYLHHQSKRIKSSNLHWYVNGLKKHQENLGFPWDDVRYDEQVVSLLKELTLHPVMASENGDDDGHGHTYGSQPNRQRQLSSSMYPSGKPGHHYSSSSIDTTRIANLSISQPQSQPQEPTHGTTYGSTGPKQHHQSHQQYMQQQQQIHIQPQRIQQPPPPKTYYHSAPIHIPSHHARAPNVQDTSYQAGSGGGHHQTSSPSMELPADVHTTRPEPSGAPSSALTKRKRDDLGFKKRRVPTSTGMEGEENDDPAEDDLKDDEFDMDDRQIHDMDDSDDLDDSNQYQPLKRRASTGTLLSQARVTAVKHSPGPFALDQHGSSTQVYQKGHYRGDSSVDNIDANSLHRQRSKQHLRMHSTDSRDEELTGNYMTDHHNRHEGIPRARDSPPDSVSSSSSLGGHALFFSERESQQRYRRVSSGGTVPSPASSTAPLSASSTTSSIATGSASGLGTGSTGKTTVHFSEVVECAQLLQAKYGHRCKDHPWGCVKISENRHLELTMKMYLDWAGLVASGRLTMDELPDLPEFRNIHPVVGGTLRRMASTPLTSIASSAALRMTPCDDTTSVTRQLASLSSKDSSSSSSGSNQAYFGPYRSLSSSPNHGVHADKDLATEETSLLSRIGSPPLLDSAQEALPLPPSAGHTTGPHMLLGRARKMPSTPSLSQHNRHYLIENDVLLRRSHPHGGSIVSNSTASSPRSEEDVSDEEALDEDEEEIDISNYALSPWATAPSVIAARTRVSEESLSHDGQRQRALTPTNSGAQQRLVSHNDISSFDKEKRRGGDEDKVLTTSVDMDAEGAVSKLGEIQEAPANETETTKEVIEDRPGGSSVDATAKVLDSMIIGKAPELLGSLT
ncbi:hypothetical protein BGX27_011450 [Mortierella sp. AM989]|nr:hypothetical protein BGX27_011450 [Mortierella sp. AM989]